MDLLEKIEKKLEPATACKFKTGKQLKRKDGEWDIVYDWTLYDSNGKELSQSKWVGFPTLKAALEDMLKHIK